MKIDRKSYMLAQHLAVGDIWTALKTSSGSDALTLETIEVERDDNAPHVIAISARDVETGCAFRFDLDRRAIVLVLNEGPYNVAST